MTQRRNEQKNGKELSYRKKPKWLKTHEEMLNIPGHKGNANLNHIETPTHSF
jgi:hypothetical protein